MPARSLLLTVPLIFAGTTGAQPLRREIDGLIRRVRAEKPANALEAAVLLVGLGKCHRGYNTEDGPVVRAPLRAIFAARRADGLFGTDKDCRVTSAWVYQAFESIGAEDNAANLRALRQAYATRFKLEGRRLDAALHPFGTGPVDGIRADYAQLIDLVQKQQRAAKKTAPRVAPKFEPWQQKGIDWLMAQQKDGMWLVPGPGGKLVPDPGISALGIAAVASKPAELRSAAETAAIMKGLRFLLASQKRSKDGSFSSYVPNYVTCAGVMALSRMLGQTEFDKEIRASLALAQKYLLGIQNVEQRSYVKSDRDYGSIGYGGDERGDLSNTQMAIEALRATGLSVQDESFAKALIFLRKLQNVPGRGGYTTSRVTEDENGKRKVKVVPGHDGGAQYYPGNSPAGYDENSDGTQSPRSYGSMTYALLKCYVLAGLDKDDARLRAALNWCFSNFTLEVNPGSKPELGEKAKYQGLYYYYLTLARALHLAGVDKVRGRDWRAELRVKLAKEQREDGSWVNAKNGRWWENNPILCTAYALLALAE